MAQDPLPIRVFGGRAVKKVILPFYIPAAYRGTCANVAVYRRLRGFPAALRSWFCVTPTCCQATSYNHGPFMGGYGLRISQGVRGPYFCLRTSFVVLPLQFVHYFPSHYYYTSFSLSCQGESRQARCGTVRYVGRGQRGTESPRTAAPTLR